MPSSQVPCVHNRLLAGGGGGGSGFFRGLSEKASAPQTSHESGCPDPASLMLELRFHSPLSLPFFLGSAVFPVRGTAGHLHHVLDGDCQAGGSARASGHRAAGPAPTLSRGCAAAAWEGDGRFSNRLLESSGLAQPFWGPIVKNLSRALNKFYFVSL